LKYREGEQKPPAEHFVKGSTFDLASESEEALTNIHTPDELEPLVLGAWQRILGDPTLTPDDDFFGAGGDSLLAVDAVEEITEATGVDVPVTTLFTSPTTTEFARALVELAESGDAGEH
jgi:acyl carrier protein